MLPMLGQSTSSVSTTLPPSSLLCCRPDGLELSIGQPPRPVCQQQQLQTTTSDGLLQPLTSTLSALEMLCDSVLCKYTIDIDIVIDDAHLFFFSVVKIMQLADGVIAWPSILNFGITKMCLVRRTFLPARKRGTCYSNVSDWVGGWVAVTLRYCIKTAKHI